MTRFVHFKLDDGRSILAAFDDAAEHVVRQSVRVVCIADNRTEQFPLSAVRECRLYDARQNLPPRTSIFDFAIAT